MILTAATLVAGLYAVVHAAFLPPAPAANGADPAAVDSSRL